MFALFEFAKSSAMRAIRASVIYVPTCQRANSVPTSHFYVSACQRANKRANGPKTCQFFNLACQRDKAYQHAKRRAIFQPRLPKGVTIFQLYFKRIIFFIYLINLYLIYFIYFAYT